LAAQKLILRPSKFKVSYDGVTWIKTVVLACPLAQMFAEKTFQELALRAAVPCSATD
jgi:hypothetical protein